MKKHTADTHEFSLYWSSISDWISAVQEGESFTVDDADLCHRVVRVLRFVSGNTFILFDTDVHVRVQLIASHTKRSIELKLLEKNETATLQPAITFFLPILKRDALEQVIYSLVELGATDIQLMSTQKVQRKWGGRKELDRLHTIMIAAAEQSKQYRIPTLHESKPFEELMQQMNVEHSFFFDPAGKELLPIIQSLHAEQPKGISLMIGPEGDLTAQEKDLLKERGVHFLCLTPTVLRAQQAVAVSMGIFRSLIR